MRASSYIRSRIGEHIMINATATIDRQVSLCNPWLYMSPREVRVELLTFVDTFLRARNQIIPPPPRPVLPALGTSESQDSQEDEYGNFGFDWND